MRRLALVFLLLATQALAAPEPYALERSRVGFTWFFGDDPVTGRMEVSRARLLLDFDRPENSRIDVAVDTTRADAGNPLAAGAMTGQSVLWTERFPEITFRSNSIRRDGAGGAIVAGDLTLRGVTRHQTFRARLFRPPGTASGDRRRLTIRLDGTLSRSAFGADGYGAMVGDEVRLRIEAVIAADP